MITSMCSQLAADIKRRVQLDQSIQNKQDMYYHTEKAIKYLHNPFNNIHTAYLQKRFMKKNWTYVEAKPIVLAKHTEMKKLRGVEKMVEIADMYYHVPLIDSLKQFLGHSQVFNMVLSEKLHAPEGYLIDFWDGTAFKGSPFFSKMDDCDQDEAYLALQLYYDDVEVCIYLYIHGPCI